jgi:glycosyltransferase involved in cell wall biosynthesis
MKVVIVCAHFPPARCGVGDYSERLFLELGRNGVDVWVITSECEVEKEKPGDSRILRAAKKWSLFSIIKILKLIKDIDPDVVHIQYHGEDFGRRPWISLFSVILKIRKRRVITTLHDLSGPWWLADFWLWLLP